MKFYTLGLAICGTEQPWFLHLFDLTTAPALLYYSYIPILVTSLLIGFFIFLNNSKVLRNRLLFAVTILFALWVLNVLIQWIASYHTILMFAWQLTAPIEVALYISVSYFAYVFFFKRDLPFWLKLLFGVIAIAILVIVPSTLNVMNYDITNCQGNNGLLWNGIYALEPSIIVLTVLMGIIAQHREKDPTYRKQIILLTVGIGLFLSIFFGSNYYGELTKIYQFNFWGPLGMFFFVVMLGYMIVQFRAFNAKLLGAQALVTALLLLLGSEYFFVRNIINDWLVTATLLLTGIFGYLLIKSVQREVQQRERIEKLADELEKSNKQQVVLIHFITHQIKGFLTKSRNIFAMALDGDFGVMPEAFIPMAQEGLRSDTQGVTTVQEILNAANVKSGAVKYSMEAFDLDALIKEVVDTLKPNADKKKLELTFTSESAPHMFTGDRLQLQNALKNLIDNSIKYTPSGSVGVSLKEEDGKLRFVIQDTGVGITKEDMARLFTEGGHGAESLKVNVESTGFGLYIVKNIIEAHHGKVWAESDGAGKGSRFVVELPLLMPPASVTEVAEVVAGI